MATTGSAQSILDDGASADRERIITLLTRAYWMEIETVMNYMAASVNPDGVRGRAIARAIADDIEEELGHTRRFAARIKELYGVVPGSVDFSAEQQYMHPPQHQTDTVSVIRAVIDAENGAIEHYTKIIRETDEIDPVTQDMVIEILHDEQAHRRLFEGFMREYENDDRGS